MELKNRSVNFGGKSSKEDFVPSLTWVNVGYYTTVTNDEGIEEEVFVSLPVGIPMDSVKTLPTDTRSNFLNELNQAKNDLTKQLKAVFDEMESGSSKKTTALSIQLFKAEERLDRPETETNRFTKKIVF